MSNKIAIVLCAIFLCQTCLAWEDETEVQPRIFFGNFTDGLLQVNSTLVLYATLGILAVTTVAVLVLSLAPDLLSGGTGTGYNRDDFQYAEQQYPYYDQSFSRSYGDYQGWWDSLTILEWIALARELYEKFDPNELDCHKRMLCEIHEVGTLSKAATAVDYAADYARYLEAFNLPENIRELLDEYMDAVDKGRTPVPTKPCGQLFSACQFSLSDVFNRAYGSNDL